LADQRFGAAHAADPFQAPARKASPPPQSGAFESTIRGGRTRILIKYTSRLSTMVPIKFNRCVLDDAANKGRTFATALAILYTIVGCASVQSDLKMEPRSVARRLGLPNCWVSTSLSQDEAIKQAKRDGSPNPEARRDWIEMISKVRPGDELRLVDCVKASKAGLVGDPYFYAVFRNDVILAKFHSVILD
jgi:hypothetical protein